MNFGHSNFGTFVMMPRSCLINWIVGLGVCCFKLRQPQFEQEVPMFASNSMLPHSFAHSPAPQFSGSTKYSPEKNFFAKPVIFLHY